MRILIYGAGVIGSLYAALFSEAGYDVSIFARGRRLEDLNNKGLLYRKDGRVQRADVHVKDTLISTDIYDFIFLTVRSEQAVEALRQLSSNQSPTIVTMINTIADYSEWEKLCGKGRILPAFPGAGGGLKDGVLDAGLTPAFIQPTTFGEIDGKHTARHKMLAKVFRKSRVPYQIVPDMHNWQLCHLGLVVPLADAYERSNEPEYVYRDHAIMEKTAKALKRNMYFFYRRGQLSPEKFRLILLCPVTIMTSILAGVYHSEFGNRFMYQHAMKASDEMRLLHKTLYKYIKRNRTDADKRL